MMFMNYEEILNITVTICDYCKENHKNQVTHCEACNSEHLTKYQYGYFFSQGLFVTSETLKASRLSVQPIVF
jgi:hypothetical protein